MGGYGGTACVKIGGRFRMILPLASLQNNLQRVYTLKKANSGAPTARDLQGLRQPVSIHLAHFKPSLARRLVSGASGDHLRRRSQRGLLRACMRQKCTAVGGLWCLALWMLGCVWHFRTDTDRANVFYQVGKRVSRVRRIKDVSVRFMTPPPVRC